MLSHFFLKERRGPRVSSNFQKKPLTGDALTNSYVKVCQGVWSLFEGVCEITLLSGEACYFYLREISSDKHHVFYFLVVAYLLINISCIGHFVLVQEGTWKVRRTGSKEEMATHYWSKLVQSTSIYGRFLPKSCSDFRSHPFKEIWTIWSHTCSGWSWSGCSFSQWWPTDHHFSPFSTNRTPSVYRLFWRRFEWPHPSHAARDFWLCTDAATGGDTVQYPFGDFDSSDGSNFPYSEYRFWKGQAAATGPSKWRFISNVKNLT